MANRCLIRQLIRRFYTSNLNQQQHVFSTAVKAENSTAEKPKQFVNNKSQWLILPPFTQSPDGSLIGKKLTRKLNETDNDKSNVTALKWILKCCPNLPRCLVQKLFRLRQVRKESLDGETKDQRAKRVGAKELMNVGDRIILPKSVDGKGPSTEIKNDRFCNEEELNLIRGHVLYKDPAIIVINKPPGMPVQGGLGIKRSLDELAAKYLKYDQTDSPRLVHRLDRDSSGILVMGRTQLSATILHSIFREKTLGASNDTSDSKRVLEKRYWALVIGSPRRSNGLITVPLMKVVIDNGKSDYITVVDNAQRTSAAQHAVTEYRVISSTSSGYTWLELSPLTGRKHQLRVHCAEVLGTPIVGDYKYGWQAHKKLERLSTSCSDLKPDQKMAQSKQDTLGLDSETGNVHDKEFRLHLHCKEMVLPNISAALQDGTLNSDLDDALIETIEIDAPLPPHMQRSWDLLEVNH